MASATLPPSKREALDALSRKDLAALVEALGLEAADRRSRAGLLDALCEPDAPDLGVILELLSRDALKEVCRHLGLDKTAFAIYGVLQKSGASLVGEGDVQKDLASVIGEEVQKYTTIVDWQNKEDLKREMRRDVRRTLRRSGVDADTSADIAEDIVDVARARFGR